MQFAFGPLGLASIVSIFQTGNDVSRRIAQRLGMGLDRRTRDPSSGHPVEVWRIWTEDASRV